jgi:DUF4097 and DUF4098 domain-containing protein YvlB
MKRLNLLGAVAIVFAITANVFAGTNPDRQDKTKSFKVNPGGKLIVNVNPGDVTIYPWDKDEMVVKVKDLGSDNERDLKLYKENNNVFVSYDTHWGWSEDVEFYINIPSKFNLDIQTTGGDVRVKEDLLGTINVESQGGDISVRNVKGETKLYTQGGDVETRDVEGSLDINTQGGDISLGEIKGKHANVSTQGGDIDIYKVGTDIQAKTYGGDISIGDVNGNADVQTYGGDVKLKNVAGSARMETYGGNVELNSASGRVIASTAGGDIKLSNVTGSVDAKTAAGDISVELYPTGKNSSRIRTSAGGITLYLPADAKATIDAVINVHGWWKDKGNEYRIKSDFEAKNYSHDSDSNEIRATYKLNGGGEEISLRAVNSDIRIIKIR